MIRNALMVNGKSKNNSDVESLDAYEDSDDGFMEGDIRSDKSIASFNFAANGSITQKSVSKEEVIIQVKSDTQPQQLNQISVPTPNGITPPVNEEYYTVKRSYSMRPSTVRKLNELKARHPDVNVFFNTIIDLAILHYHNYIVNNDGEFTLQEEKKENS